MSPKEDEKTLRPDQFGGNGEAPAVNDNTANTFHLPNSGEIAADSPNKRRLDDNADTNGAIEGFSPEELAKMSRSERKRHREKKRRSDVNNEPVGASGKASLVPTRTTCSVE